MKKSMIKLITTANGEEYFQLNRNEQGTVLTTKNHTRGLDATEDHSNGKMIEQPGERCPVAHIKAYLSHLNPENDATRFKRQIQPCYVCSLVFRL